MSPPRIDALTGARFLAALLVFSLHINLLVHWQLWPGYSGVTFFFILSGFVLTWAYGDIELHAAQLIRYVGNRIGRIVPVFWLAFLLSVPVAIHDFHHDWSLAALAAVLNLSLLHAWVHDLTVYFSYDSPSWTLSVEACFYLLFPLVAVTVRRVNSGRAALALVAAAMAAETALAAAVVHATGKPMEYWTYIFPPTRLSEFLIGSLLARCLVLKGSGRNAKTVLYAGLGWAVAALVLGQVLPDHLGMFRASVVFIPGYAAIVWGLAAAPRTRVAGWLSAPTLVRLGEASYAFYLLHQIVLRYVHGAVLVLHLHLNAAESWGAVAACLALAVVLSVVVFERFETPLRRMIRAEAARRADAVKAAVETQWIAS